VHSAHAQNRKTRDMVSRGLFYKNRLDKQFAGFS
jgi:hypothetical protein